MFDIESSRTCYLFSGIVSVYVSVSSLCLCPIVIVTMIGIHKFFQEVHFKVLYNQEPVVPEAIMKDSSVDFVSDF